MNIDRYLAFYQAYPRIVEALSPHFARLLPALPDEGEKNEPKGKVEALSPQSGLPPGRLLNSLSYSYVE